MREVFAAVLVSLLVVACYSGVFFEEPSPAVVAENDTAVFYCRINSGHGSLDWTVNGNYTSYVSNPDIVADSGPAADGGPRVHTLTIVARRVYNGTTVQCFVNPVNVISSTTLLIQGPLAAVKNLTAEPGTDSILFRWGAPFSLNLTNNNTDIEPDISYCVDVYNSTNDRTELVGGVCDLTDTSYSFTANETLPCDLFTVVVTPVNGAGNGSASDAVNFVDAPDVEEAEVSEVEFIYDEDETITTVMISVDFKTIVHICTCDVMINTTDGRDPEIGRMVELVENAGQSSLTIPFNDTVPDRIWSMNILLENSAGSATTGQLHLSTHDVQNITTVSDSPSGMEFNVKFATNSLALGCVVIVKSGSMEAVFVKYRDIDSTSDQFTVAGLPPASYDMAGFDLEGSSGLPGNYSAVNEPLESRETGSQPLGVEEGVIAEAVLITLTDGAVCVKCSIPAVDNATECVLIIHPTEGLEEIETVVLMNGEEHCIPDPSSMEYSVARFGRLDSKIVSLSNAPSEPGSSTPSLVGTVIGVVLALAIIVAVLVGLAGLVLLRRRVKRVRGVTLPDTEKPTAPNKDTRPVAPLLVQDAAGGPPPPPSPLHCTSDDESKPAYATITSKPFPNTQESAHDINSNNARPIINAARGPPPPPESENSTDGGSPNPSVSSVESLPEPTKQEPLYDTPDKNVTQKKSGTGSVYTNTVHDKSIKAPPEQDTKVSYAQPVKIVDHNATAADAKSLQPAPPVATSAPAALPPLTVALLYDVLYEIRGAWKALAEQFKQSDDLIDEIDTNNEKDEACLRQVLEFWFKNSDFQHTWSEVVTALEEIGQQALADSIHNTYVPPGVEGLPGSQQVSLPPSSLPSSSLQPPQQDPLPQGSFAVSSPTAMDEEAAQSPSPTPITKRPSVPSLVGRECGDVLKAVSASGAQLLRSPSEVEEKDDRETNNVAPIQKFVESPDNEDKSSPQETYTTNVDPLYEESRQQQTSKPAPRNGPDCEHGCS